MTTSEAIFKLIEYRRMLERNSEIDAEPFDMAIEALKKQKIGKWITKSDTNPYYTTWWYECSECGQSPLRDGYEQEVLSDYCPNCGAKMEVEE